MMAELMRCRVQRLIMLLILGFTVAGSSADAGNLPELRCFPHLPHGMPYLRLLQR